MLETFFKETGNPLRPARFNGSQLIESNDLMAHGIEFTRENVKENQGSSLVGAEY